MVFMRTDCGFASLSVSNLQRGQSRTSEEAFGRSGQTEDIEMTLEIPNQKV